MTLLGCFVCGGLIETAAMIMLLSGGTKVVVDQYNKRRGKCTNCSTAQNAAEPKAVTMTEDGAEHANESTPKSKNESDQQS